MCNIRHLSIALVTSPLSKIQRTRAKPFPGRNRRVKGLMPLGPVEFTGAIRSLVGTATTNDTEDKLQPLNYDQMFIRDFVPSAHTFLLKGEGEIVRNFLLHNLQLQVCI